MARWHRDKESKPSHQGAGPTEIDILSDKIARVEQMLAELKAILLRVERQLSSPLDSQGTKTLYGVEPVASGSDWSEGARQVTDGVSSDDLKTTLSDFVNRANEGPLSLDEARELSRVRGCCLEVVRWVGNEWRVVAIAATRSSPNRTWLAVPVPRVPMGEAALDMWYELNRYSGIDPLRPSQIKKPAVLVFRDGTWSLVEKGQIDGGA